MSPHEQLTLTVNGVCLIAALVSLTVGLLVGRHAFAVAEGSDDNALFAKHAFRALVFLAFGLSLVVSAVVNILQVIL